MPRPKPASVHKLNDVLSADKYTYTMIDAFAVGFDVFQFLDCEEDGIAYLLKNGRVLALASDSAVLSPYVASVKEAV